MTGRADPAGFAPGHSRGREVPHWHFDAAAPCGALRSSARDLALFVQEFLGFEESPMKPLFAESIRPNGKLKAGGAVGFGWLMTAGAEPILNHEGGTGGFKSFIAIDLKLRRGIVILVNDTRELGPLAMSLIRRGPASPASAGAPEIKFNPEDYVGAYPLSPTFVMKVTHAGSRLFVQASGQQQLALIVKSADRFQVRGVDAEISFERDAHGHVVALVLHQNGADQRAPRQDLTN